MSCATDGPGGGGVAKQGTEDLLHDLTPSSAGLGVEIEREFGREHGGTPEDGGISIDILKTPLQKVGLNTGGLKAGEASSLEWQSGVCLLGLSSPSH